MIQALCLWHENLAAMAGNRREPLSNLTPDSHVHGGLRFKLGDRLVPYMGYFGEDDVCFGTWLPELSSVARVFESSPIARHVFDEGEQGQPAFVFEREADRAYFSIRESELSDGQADDEWQRVEFSPEEFLLEYRRFTDSFFLTLEREAPAHAAAWIARHMDSSS